MLISWSSRKTLLRGEDGGGQQSTRRVARERQGNDDALRRKEEESTTRRSCLTRKKRVSVRLPPAQECAASTLPQRQKVVVLANEEQSWRTKLYRGGSTRREEVHLNATTNRQVTAQRISLRLIKSWLYLHRRLRRRGRSEKEVAHLYPRNRRREAAVFPPSYPREVLVESPSIPYSSPSTPTQVVDVDGRSTNGEERSRKTGRKGRGKGCWRIMSAQPARLPSSWEQG